MLFVILVTLQLLVFTSTSCILKVEVLMHKLSRTRLPEPLQIFTTRFSSFFLMKDCRGLLQSLLLSRYLKFQISVLCQWKKILTFFFFFTLTYDISNIELLLEHAKQLLLATLLSTPVQSKYNESVTWLSIYLSI